MATRRSVGVFFCCDMVLVWFGNNGPGRRQGELKRYLCSRPWPAGDRATPLQRTQPALHVVEAIATDNARRVKTATIVANLNGQNFARLLDRDLDFRGVPVLDHIVYRFLH